MAVVFDAFDRVTAGGHRVVDPLRGARIRAVGAGGG
jgi:hypothetical protein